MSAFPAPTRHSAAARLVPCLDVAPNRRALANPEGSNCSSPPTPRASRVPGPRP
jgi:hypothetical protein